jgi:hypothetical protein
MHSSNARNKPLATHCKKWMLVCGLLASCFGHILFVVGCACFTLLHLAPKQEFENTKPRFECQSQPRDEAP